MCVWGGGGGAEAHFTIFNVKLILLIGLFGPTVGHAQ